MIIRNIRLSSIMDELNCEIDVLLCCSSFEERCKSIPMLIPHDRIKLAYIFKNKEFIDQVKDNIRELKSHFEGKYIEKEIEHLNPIVTADCFNECLRECFRKKMQSFLIDITTFTHESLLMLLQLLRIILKKEHKVIFAYSSAADYGGDENDDYNDRWLSKGVRDVRAVLGYSGRFLPTNNLHLIIIVGYEHERASELIEILEPTGISLGYGKPGSSVTKKGDVANKFYFNLVKNTAATYANVSDFEIFCNDPLQTRDVLNQVVGKIDTKRTNVIIAPMNNKISTIGAALTAINQPEIQICYAPALHYNVEKYSIPGSEGYLLELPELFE